MVELDIALTHRVFLDQFLFLIEEFVSRLHIPMISHKSYARNHNSKSLKLSFLKRFLIWNMHSHVLFEPIYSQH